MSEKEKNKQPDISFFQKFNNPKSQFSSSTDSAWSFMKNRLKQPDVEEINSDGKDFLEVKKEDIKRDGFDFFSKKSSEQLLIPDGLDKLQPEVTLNLASSDRLDTKPLPDKLAGNDYLVKSEKMKLSLPGDDTFVSFEEKQDFIKEKISYLHQQIIDISHGFEKKIIPFEKREDYIKEIEQYIWRKKKSISRFYGMEETERVRYLITRGFDVFLQALGELKLYLRDDFPMHTRLARELSGEGNNLFTKAKDIMSLIRSRHV